MTRVCMVVMCVYMTRVCMVVMCLYMMRNGSHVCLYDSMGVIQWYKWYTGNFMCLGGHTCSYDSKKVT